MNPYIKLHLDNQARERSPAKVENAADGQTLYIYDMISADWGIGAKDVIAALATADASKTLNVRINSPGGDVFESRAIIEALGRFEGGTVAHIDSLAASAATSIALACGTVNMAEGAMFMIHNAKGMVWGDKHDMRKTADLLEKVEGAIVTDYTSKTGKPDSEIVQMMDAETWMTAQEALDHGFVNAITKTAKASNTWNLAAFNKAPKMPEPDPAPTPSMTQANTNRLRLALL